MSSSTSSSSVVVASREAYVKALLHCYKHPTQPLLGMLIGKHMQSEGAYSCYVADALPLFHTAPMTYPHPMVHVAYAHAQSAAKTRGMTLLGVYVAAERLDDRTLAAPLRPLLEHLQSRMPSGVRLLVWFVDNATLLSPPQQPSITCLSYLGAECIGRPIPTPAAAATAATPSSSGGSRAVSTVAGMTVLPLVFGEWNSDTLAPEARESVEAAVEAVGNALYAFAQYKLVDLEDHLENPQLNYLEQPLAQLMRK